MAARFLFLLQNLELGGIQRQLLEVCRALVERGDRVAVATFRSEGDAMAPAFRSAGVETLSLHRRGRYDLAFLLRLRRLLASRRFDLVQAMTPEAGMWVSLLLPRRGPVLVGSVLNVYFFDDPLPCRAEALLTARRAAAVLVNSRRAAALYARRVSPSTRVVAIANGVRPAAEVDREGLRHRWGVPPDAFLAMSVGRLSEVKGHRIALRALARARQAGSGCHLALVGEGPLLQPLKRLAADLRISEQVHFLGGTSEPEQFLAAADMFLLPSLSEGLPNALLEAMAAGLPCVASAVGGIPEAVDHRREALLVPPSRPDSLAKAMQALESSPGLRSRLGDAARRRALADFPLSTMLDKTLALYDELLAGQGWSAEHQTERRTGHAA